MPAGGSLESPLIQLMFGWAPSNFGVMGIFTAASVVFFAFIGFDVVATAAEETKNPQRDMPRGILGSLVICTTLYVAVSIVVTGMQHYTKLSVDAPLADAFKATGHPWFAGFISFGAAVGLTTVCMILLLGQTRVFFAMSRDGLLPRFFSHVHPRFRTPHRPTILLGVIIAILAGFTRLSELADLVNIGTLFAFVVVAIGVIILRTHPPRPAPVLPHPVGAGHPDPVGARLAVADAQPARRDLAAVRHLDGAGFLVYFLYGRSHSRLGPPGGDDRPARCRKPRAGERQLRRTRDRHRAARCGLGADRRAGP